VHNADGRIDLRAQHTAGKCEVYSAMIRSYIEGGVNEPGGDDQASVDEVALWAATRGFRSSSQRTYPLIRRGKCEKVTGPSMVTWDCLEVNLQAERTKTCAGAQVSALHPKAIRKRSVGTRTSVPAGRERCWDACRCKGYGLSGLRQPSAARTTPELSLPHWGMRCW
jgi:hypothetical protein